MACNYRRKNFAGEDLCILDPDHLAMEKAELKKYVIENIKISPEKKDCWITYFKAVTMLKENCSYLDKSAIKDKSKRIAWIPDDLQEDLELIPDSSLGPKCRCLYPNKYEK